MFVAGQLITNNYSIRGQGGSAVVYIACSSCCLQHQFSNSSLSATESWRNVVLYALRLAAFATGVGFSSYHKLFARHLGMEVTAAKMFQRVIEEAYPHITVMLDNICELGEEEMKEMSGDQLGSWKRAVTTSDGCWHIRGFFSQNATFVIHNWITGSLLWYGHACMKGSDPILQSEELYEGTAKSSGGYLASLLFSKGKRRRLPHWDKLAGPGLIIWEILSVCVRIWYELKSNEMWRACW